ncbi:hypothetical protein BegalDRAFT_0010 [Beggiatoa alba B18LD]|uniref:Toprim domain-containing protein n=1 Tax=Beggiatoa alba B18LD TaxID=395493 RepID=I3CL84_9GAMM|nr:toprim domain-containing protein [Beggiatoa alba]EIJ44377.1 hypothetical protein BegalDRAFT_0010 [Beggiatoa alba B18LD]
MTSYQQWLIDNQLAIESDIYTHALNWLNQQASADNHDTISTLSCNTDDFITLSVNGKTAKSKAGYKVIKTVQRNKPVLNVLYNHFKNGQSTYQSTARVKELWEAFKLNKQPLQAAKPITQTIPISTPQTTKSTVTSDLTKFDKLPVTGVSEYLNRKQIAVKLPVELRFSNDKLGKYIALLVTDIEGNKRGLQRIYDNGDKRFSTGLKKQGGFIAIGDYTTALNIAICEGFATGASIHLATGYAVLCALDAGNIGNVATHLKSWLTTKGKYTVNVVVCADNDINNSENVGLNKALNACQNTGFKLAYPKSDNSKDFNDLHIESSLEAIKPCIDNATVENIATKTKKAIKNPPTPAPALDIEAINSTENTPAPVLKKRKYVFWYVNKKGELKISNVDFLNFLEKSGFSRIYLNPLESTLVQIFNNSLIEEASAEKIRDFTLSYVDSLDGVITEKHDARDLRSALIKASNVYFGHAVLSCLKPLKKPFITDSKTSSYVFYRNAVVVVTKDSIDTIPYSQLNGIIWKDSVLDRDIELLPKSELRNGMFARFQYNVCSPADVRKKPPTNEQKQLINKRFSVLKSTMGYLMHRFCNPNQLKATVFCDEKVSDLGNEGRSGKGLSMSAIRQFRNVTIIDGKSFDSGNRFKFQHATPSTEVIFFDDIDKNFKLEVFYSVLSEISLGSLTIERKNSPLIPLKQAIKVAMTTNHTIRGDSASHRARKHEIELSYYYDDKFTPAVEFSCMFFSEWDKSEWLLFDNYMLHCLQFYLERGLIEPVVINLKLRKLLDETAHEFVEFADDIPRNEKFDKSVVYDNFIEEYPDFNRGYKAIKQRTFTNWLKMYCDYKGLKFSESRGHTNCYFTLSGVEVDKQTTHTPDFIVNDNSQTNDFIDIISVEYHDWCKTEINKLPYPKSTHIAVCECLTRFKHESKDYNINDYLADLITALQNDVKNGNDTTQLIQLIYDYGIYSTNEIPVVIPF